MNPPKTTETLRLRLRQPIMDDAAAIFERYATDPDVTKYLAWRPHENLEVTKNFLNWCFSVWEKGSNFPYVITLKEDNQHQPIGTIEIRINRHRAEVGYALAKAYWGQGYMTETAQAVLDWILKQNEIFRVSAYCDVENIASARVLEKVEMQREGILRRWGIHPNISREPRDVYVYSKVK